MILAQAQVLEHKELIEFVLYLLSFTLNNSIKHIQLSLNRFSFATDLHLS